MADEPRKRSRFDQKEPDPPRKSRFDRRSRSPARREPEESRGSGSPNEQSESRKAASANIAAAQAAAARIAASLAAKKGIQHVDVPPIRAVVAPVKAPAEDDEDNKDGVYQQDGDYIKDIEVNDLRNRYTLTKGSTQKQIKEETGADVTTRGAYYPDKSLATAANPPLYLHITSTTKEGLEKAVAKIEEMMNQELPNLIDERRFRRREEPERDAQGRRKWPEARIPIDLEPIPGFNLRASVVGHGGQNCKHIQSETSCRVQIKGRGSGFTEADTGAEADEAMYLYVAGPDPEKVKEAEALAQSLVANIRERYEAFKEGRGQEQSYGGGGGGGGGYNDRGYHRDRDRNASGGQSAYGGQQYGGNSAYGNTGYGYGGAQSPIEGSQTAYGSVASQATAQGASMSADQYQAWAAYYAQNPAEDPYAQYGGFAVAMQAYYAQYQQQALGQAGSPVHANSPGYGAYSPANGSAPTPNGQGGYNAVPPPPGM